MNDRFFVHAHSAKKLEVAGLLPNWTMESVLMRISALSVKELEDIPPQQKRLLLPALVLLKKPSCDKYSEGRKVLVVYNNGYYLIRIYRFVGQEFYKLEVTKFVNSQQTHLVKSKTITGCLKLMKNLVQDVEDEVLPSHLHQGYFFSLDEF